MCFTGFAFRWQENTEKVILNYDFYSQRDMYVKMAWLIGKWNRQTTVMGV
jgi:hypothetical protein